jgi:hypothetical protein
VGEDVLGVKIVEQAGKQSRQKKDRPGDRAEQIRLDLGID